MHIYFFFNDTATTEIYTLSLHDALPTCAAVLSTPFATGYRSSSSTSGINAADRKSTRLNSSHPSISYAVFCLKKKKNNDKLAVNIYTSTAKVTRIYNPENIALEYSRLVH